MNLRTIRASIQSPEKKLAPTMYMFNRAPISFNRVKTIASTPLNRSPGRGVRVYLLTYEKT